VTALRRLPPWLGAALDRTRARVADLDPLGRQLLALGAVVALVVAIGAVLALTGSGAQGSADAEASRDSFLTRLMPAPEQAGEGRTAAAVRKIAAGLSLEEKVDQLTLLGFEGLVNGALEKRLARGEVGGLAVSEENYVNTGQLERLVKGTQARARRADRVPPLFMVSQEGGELSALSDVPPAFAPADTASIEEAADEALDSAKALRSVGIDGVLGPVLDVGAADGGPLGLRPFSDDAREIARYARVVVPSYVTTGLVSAPLHFPGLGGTASSTDEGPAQVGLSINQLRRADLLPFRAAIESGAQAIVVGHGLYGTDDFAVPASASRYILTDLLRDELGFKGLAITDDLAAGAITVVGSSADSAVASIIAGADMVRLSGPGSEQRRMREALIAAARDGRISRERLNDATVRVLEAKRIAGVLPKVKPDRRVAGVAATARRRARARTGPRPTARRADPQPAPRTPPRATASTRVPTPGLDRNEGRPAGPGGRFGPERREPETPGLDVREGRSPGPGGVRQKPRRRKRPRPQFTSPNGFQQTVPGTGTTSPSQPRRTIIIPSG
jgi:beta-N-acetylhexosaminidase